MNTIRRLVTPLLAAACLCLCGVSCASLDAPVPSTAPPPDLSPSYSSAPKTQSLKLRLLGADLEALQAVYPNGGPQIAIQGLKTSPGLGLITGTINNAVQWGGLAKIANGWFGSKNVESTQAGLTKRAQIGADAQVRTSELNLLKPAEAVTQPLTARP